MLFGWSSRSFHEASTGLYRVECCESASGLESPNCTFFQADALDEMRRHDEWLNIQEHSFSIKKIGQYFCTCKPLSAQDADGWLGREHVGWLFSDGDSALL